MKENSSYIVTAIGLATYNKALETKTSTSTWENKKFDPQDPNNVAQGDGSYKDGRGNTFTVDSKGNMVNEDGINIKEKVTTSNTVGGVRRTGQALGKGLKNTGVKVAEKTGLFNPTSSRDLQNPLNKTDNPINEGDTDNKAGSVSDPLNKTNNHKTSFVNLDKDIVAKNGESTNPSKTKQEINARLDEVSANNAKSFAKGVDNGGISEKDFIAKEQNIANARKGVELGKKEKGIIGFVSSFFTYM